MIFGQLPHLAIAHEINPGVTDVADEISGLRQKQRGDGTAHSQLVAFCSCSLVNGSIRIAESTGDFFVCVGSLEIIEVGELVAYHLDRHLARDFARRVPTHPVRDYEQPAVSVGRSVERVFISLSNPADISASRDSKVH
jgi:hypothetical protein